MSDEIFVQGDTGPDLTVVLLKRGNPLAPVDLTNATGVFFQMRKPDDRRYTVNAQATMDNNRASGKVTYQWGANDLSNDGLYQAQFEIHWADSKEQTTKTPLLLEVRRQ